MLTQVSPPTADPRAPAGAAGDPALLDQRYLLRRELGRGAMGTVYLAQDRESGAACALKILQPLGDKDTGEFRFRREFRAAARLRHPFCLPVYHLGRTPTALGPRWYYTMMYQPGGSLADLLRGGPLPPPRAAALAAQALCALDHIHARGIIHRDIKPENILLDESGGAIRLSDFGIAQVSDASGEASVGQIIGTLPYLAPECAAGLRDARADLYALGVVLYRMLAGRLPFQGHSAGSWLRLHREAPCPPLTPPPPPALSAVLRRLLAKDPAERPSSAAEVYDELLAYLGEVGVALPPHPPLERAVPLFAPRFSGRAPELRRCAAFLEALAAPGAPRGGDLLAVRGEAGMGKSRLLTELLARAEGAGVLVLPGACSAEPDVPFAPVLPLLAAIGVSLGDPPGAADLDATLVTMATGRPLPLGATPELPQAARVLSSFGDEEERWRFQRQVVDAALALCARQPTLIVLEDAHWADLPALQLLSGLLRAARAEQARLGVFVTLRPAPEHAALSALLAYGEILDLRPLDEDATAALIASMLGAPAAREVQEAVSRGNGGIPLYIAQGLHLLHSSGALRSERGRVLLARGGAGAGDLAQVEDAIGEKAARLSGGCKRALLAAAVLGRRFAPAELAGVLGVSAADEPLLLDWLDEGIRAGFLDEDGFRHDRFREALYGHLSAPERAGLHRAAADVIARVRGLRPERAAELARHLPRARGRGPTGRCCWRASTRRGSAPTRPRRICWSRRWRSSRASRTGPRGGGRAPCWWSAAARSACWRIGCRRGGATWRSTWAAWPRRRRASRCSSTWRTPATAPVTTRRRCGTARRW